MFEGLLDGTKARVRLTHPPVIYAACSMFNMMIVCISDLELAVLIAYLTLYNGLKYPQHLFDLFFSQGTLVVKCTFLSNQTKNMLVITKTKNCHQKIPTHFTFGDRPIFTETFLGRKVHLKKCDCQ